MRSRLPALGACLLAACAAGGGGLRVEESGLPRAREAPPPPGIPRRGEFEATDSREIVFIARAGGGRAVLRAWCRIGVWTTLEERTALDFVVRESWGRLGERKPRLLRRIGDQALSGVVARLRPGPDGGLRFVVEVAEVAIGPARPAGVFHGEEVTLGNPRRHGYLFEGAAPPGWAGAVARWGEVRCYVGNDRSDAAPPGAVRFQAGEERGFVAGARPRAEAFLETWAVMTPYRTEADGVERMDFRLVREREAAGFAGKARTYGADFRFD